VSVVNSHVFVTDKTTPYRGWELKGSFDLAPGLSLAPIDPSLDAIL